MDPTAADFCTPYPPDAFRPLPDQWRTEAVLGLASGIRTEEAFDRMPILADALEEAGCDDPRVLNHCRFGERHGPWCWVIEVILPSVEPSPKRPTAEELAALRGAARRRHLEAMALLQRVRDATEAAARRAGRVRAVRGCAALLALFLLVLLVVLAILFGR